MVVFNETGELCSEDTVRHWWSAFVNCLSTLIAVVLPDYKEAAKQTPNWRVIESVAEEADGRL
jgi:hypothetical protein